MLSVILFLSCSVVGFLILILRRQFVKGELGGESFGRYGSAFAFILLWIVYVILSGLGTYEVIDLDAAFADPSSVARNIVNAAATAVGRARQALDNP